MIKLIVNTRDTNFTKNNPFIFKNVENFNGRIFVFGYRFVNDNTKYTFIIDTKNDVDINTIIKLLLPNSYNIREVTSPLAPTIFYCNHILDELEVECVEKIFYSDERYIYYYSKLLDTRIAMNYR